MFNNNKINHNTTSTHLAAIGFYKVKLYVHMTTTTTTTTRDNSD